MVPVPCVSTAPVPPPSYQRAVATSTPALHIDALTLVTRLHLLVLCRLAVGVAHRHCPPPCPRGRGQAAHLQRGEHAADRPAAHALAAELPGHARVARRLARPGLRPADGRRRSGARAQPLADVALSFTTTIIVALAAHDAGRPDLIRSSKRVLAHLWEAPL